MVISLFRFLSQQLTWSSVYCTKDFVKKAARNTTKNPKHTYRYEEVQMLETPTKQNQKQKKNKLNVPINEIKQNSLIFDF